MQLNKNQIEAVRYQLKKLNTTSTNEEIRLTANGVDDFDAVLIAQQIVANKTQSLVISEDNDNDVSILESSQQGIENRKQETENEETPQSSGLATTTKNELVASTADNLGIELSTAEIDQIADNFDAGSDDFSQILEQVKTAIIAYVQHKIASNNQKIVNTINEISQVASDGFEENSQTLTNGLKQLNQQLVQQSSDFKSRLAGTLSRFKLPEAS